MVKSFFLDTSAILKRYKSETGTTWIETLTDFGSGHQIILGEITLAETAAALAALHRASGGFTQQERDDILDMFLRHCAIEYRLIAVNRTIIDRAVNLTQNHKLRGCDSIQLATALLTNESLVLGGSSSLTFVAADNDLLQAAQSEGLQTENPNVAVQTP